MTNYYRWNESLDLWECGLDQNGPWQPSGTLAGLSYAEGLDVCRNQGWVSVVETPEMEVHHA